MTDNKKPKLIEATASDDPFDLSKLRVSQDFLATTAVKKQLTTVPIRKPGRQDFVRVHPSPAYRQLLALIELKDDREIYVVSQAALPDLQTECFYATVHTAITRTGVLFLWPVRVPAADGRANEWHVSGAVAAEQAIKNWICTRANMSLGAYEIFQAESSIPDPVWPEYTFEQLTRIAFKDRVINTSDHPVIKRLRGG